jgi:hypothetical protein
MPSADAEYTTGLEPAALRVTVDAEEPAAMNTLLRFAVAAP